MKPPVSTHTSNETPAASIEGSVRHVALAVLVLAGVGLAFQVSLTRVFSLLFQYHFVFMVVSLAILGLGLGAAAGYAALRFRWTEGRLRTVAISTLWLTLWLPLCAYLLSQIRSDGATYRAALLALTPFALLGWINALVYAQFAAHSGKIYGADLVGAALGLVLAPVLLVMFGPFGSILALSALVGLAALALSRTLAGSRQVITALAVLLVIGLAAFTFLNRSTHWITYRPEDVTDAPPDKTMVRVLNDPDLDAEVIATKWGAFAQVDVVGLDGDPNMRFVFTDAGAGSFMRRYDPDVDENTSWLYNRNVEFLPFLSGPVDRTLIIGAGAGYDVYLARQAGAEAITAVEINPTIVDVTREQADFNGGILDLPGVTTVVTDGRNFTDRSEEQFDLIYLNIVYSQAATPGVSSLAENYAFTTEALRSYWSRLSDEGRIAFVTHNGLEGLRLLMTTLAALEEEGITLPDALKHTALVKLHEAPNPTVASAVLIIKRQPWTEEETAAFAARTVDLSGDPNSNRKQWMDPLFIPYQFESPLAVLLDGTMSLEQYVSQETGYNLFPTTDDRPFFYHLDVGLPDPLRNLATSSALVTLAYFIVVASLQPRKPRHEWTRIALAAYFGLLGAGFLLAEVALIQRFRLLLGDPILSLSVTLGAMLLGGGLGSLFSHRYRTARLVTLIALAALGVGLWLFISTFVYPALVERALPASLPVRGGVTVAVLLPLGFLMGIPFPSGLRLAEEADPDGIPLFWGMNAIASTLGAVLATVLALLVGFQWALLVGAVLYLLAAALVRVFWPRVVVA